MQWHKISCRHRGPVAVLDLAWNTCACGGLDNAKGKDADCSIVFKYGMKRDFNA